ncbi:MAG: Ribosomal RNA small subunit methyltransferase D [Candidatus Anoxychlamydiales bacterium]|nr:Ribosomal RNA small subunit methyltransferase D [Candidatus Anoxychlamydiales bacterium]
MSLKILAGKFKGKKLLTTTDIRPATSLVRDAIFNISQNFIQNANFLDVFSGSGALGLEALSRGARFSTFIDKNFKSCQIIKKNIKTLCVEEQTKIIKKDAIKAIKSLKNSFDVITIDPPFIIYKQNPSYIDELLSLLKNLNLITQNSLIFLEEPTYSKRETNINALNLVNKRKYGSCFLLEYALNT